MQAYALAVSDLLPSLSEKGGVIRVTLHFLDPKAGGRFIDSITVPLALPPWLSEADLAVYVEAFERSGFRGGLNWYRNVARNWERSSDLAEAKISQPALFITGSRDPARNPEAIKRLREVVPHLVGTHILEGCGHWTQQERPHDVNRLLRDWLPTLSRGR